MDVKIFSIFLVFGIGVCLSADPTLYEYYTSGGIKSGLKADSEDFTLNGKKLTIFGGSLHYFRLPKAYWKDRLLKYKAAGLNTIEFYSPWNIHEETPGNFDFETGYLNLADFLTAIKEADMFVIYRIGPYICGEWENGGYPAWLLRDPNLKPRSSYKPLLNLVGIYFSKLLPIINKFQFTKGGPIIMLQFENEFGGIWNQDNRDYFNFLKDTITKSGFNELLSNCDGDNAPSVVKTLLPGVLETIDFNSNTFKKLTELRQSQPNKPLLVTEFWPGWFDGWGSKQHSRMTIEYFTNEVTDILFKANASINFYMFFGGTNFGFMNGGNVVTSYDYNAPLSESANYTDKYWKSKEIYAKLTKERGLPMIRLPDPPKIVPAAKYGVVKINDYLSLDDLLTNIKAIPSTTPTKMELLNIGSNYGQNFGFILYRISTKKFKQLKITGGVSNRGIVLIDGKHLDIITSNQDYTLTTIDSQFSNTTTTHTLDIIVENTGREYIGDIINYNRKGINGAVSLDNVVNANFTIYPMEFKEKYVNGLAGIKGRTFEKVNSPALYRAQLILLHDAPRDTYLRLDNWVKGNVFVNGVNMGRYYDIGPQKTLYIPAPYLKLGKNEIFVFELHSAANSIEFLDQPDLGK